MSSEGHRYLDKYVTVYPAFDQRMESAPMDHGKVIGYIDRPSVIIEREDGSKATWSTACPMEIGDQPTTTNDPSRNRETA